MLAESFAAISISQLALITGATLIASVIGGVSGYGTGALMPLVLVPILGPAPVVPIIALSSLFSNAGRTAAFRRQIPSSIRPCSSWRRSFKRTAASTRKTAVTAITKPAFV